MRLKYANLPELWPYISSCSLKQASKQNSDYFLMTKAGGNHLWHPGGVKSGTETEAAALGICPRMGLLTQWMEKGEMHLLCVRN